MARPRSFDLARTLRQNMSLPEMMIWGRIKARTPGQPVFRRQYPIGVYVLDFYCAKAKLAVEIDGLAHTIGDRGLRDEARDAWLRTQGLDVLRIVAAEVLTDPDAAADGIVLYAMERLRLLKG